METLKTIRALMYWPKSVRRGWTLRGGESPHCPCVKPSQKHKISKLWTQICHRTLATGLLFSPKVEIMSLDGR